MWSAIHTYSDYRSHRALVHLARKCTSCGYLDLAQYCASVALSRLSYTGASRPSTRGKANIQSGSIPRGEPCQKHLLRFAENRIGCIVLGNTSVSTSGDLQYQPLWTTITATIPPMRLLPAPLQQDPQARDNIQVWKTMHRCPKHWGILRRTVQRNEQPCKN